MFFDILFGIVIIGAILWLVGPILFYLIAQLFAIIFFTGPMYKKKKQEKAKRDKIIDEIGISKEDVPDGFTIIESAYNNSPSHKFWEILPIKKNVHRVNIDLTNYRHNVSASAHATTDSMMKLGHKDFDIRNKQLMEAMYKIAALNIEPTIFKLYFYNAGVEQVWTGQILIHKGFGVYLPYVDNIAPYQNSPYYDIEHKHDHYDHDKKCHMNDFWGNTFILGCGGINLEHVWAIEWFKKIANGIDFDNTFVGDKTLVSYYKGQHIDLGDMRGWTLNNANDDKSLKKQNSFYYPESITFDLWPMGVFNAYSKPLNAIYCNDPTYKMIGVHRWYDYKDIQQIGNDVRIINKDGSETVLKNAERNASPRLVAGNLSTLFVITPKVAI